MKGFKIFVDACMATLMVLLIITSKANLALHIILGHVFIPVAVIHLLLNGKWLLGTIKRFFNGEINSKARHMFRLVVGLTIAFFACISSGIVMYQSGAYHLHHLHIIATIACLILVILHVKVHWGYLKSFFKTGLSNFLRPAL